MFSISCAKIESMQENMLMAYFGHTEFDAKSILINIKNILVFQKISKSVLTSKKYCFLKSIVQTLILRFPIFGWSIFDSLFSNSSWIWNWCVYHESNKTAYAIHWKKLWIDGASRNRLVRWKNVEKFNIFWKY